MACGHTHSKVLVHTCMPAGMLQLQCAWHASILTATSWSTSAACQRACCSPSVLSLACCHALPLAPASYPLEQAPYSNDILLHSNEKEAVDVEVGEASSADGAVFKVVPSKLNIKPGNKQYMGRTGLCSSRWGCVQGRPKQAQALIPSQVI
eukprot:1160002-Pelagomonas_calceolata.AAC.18